MRTLLRLLAWGLAALIALGAAALGLVWTLMSGSLPDYEARYEVEGIGAETRIIRDARAVPHIFGESDEDVYFALGLAHAQDRLWQMELARRTAQGRLSEFFGEPALGFDRMMRALDLYTLSRGAARRQSAETTAALEAYAAGVNAWIRVVNREALGRGAPELFAYGDQALAPWTPADTIGILKVMALRLSGAARSETRRAKLLSRLSPERLADLLPDYPDAAAIAMPDFAALYPGLDFPEIERAEIRPDIGADFFRPQDSAGASNAWAVDGSRAAAGAPLLATDPHLWLSAPSVWMLARLEFPDGGVIGATIAGAPFVVVGRNESFGWGLTTAGMDDQDVYIEKVDPEDTTRYLTPTGWEPFRTRTETIRVSGAEDLVETLRWTRHGPVVPTRQFGLADAVPDGHVGALAWTALTENDRSIEAGLKLMRARSIEEALEAAALHVAPAQNVIMADETGVGMVVAGHAPERARASRTKGRAPSLGWLPENDWRGILPFSRAPRAIRPASGVVANANNRTTDADFPNHLSFDWDAPYRIRRIEQRLNEREFHTVESFVAIQTDAVSDMARGILPLIARDLWWGEREVADARDARRARALDLLAEWNGEMTEHGPEPLIFTAWMRALTRRLAMDELGPLLAEVAGPRPLFVERVFRDVEGAGIWCDVDKTPERETCRDIARAALNDALDELAEEHGADVESWRWGEAHRAIHAHVPFGRNEILAAFFNIEQETSGGDYTILRAKTPGAGPRPYLNVHAAGFRGIYDFADLDRSLQIIATGQSGHVLSRHFDDLSELWRRGDYAPMSLDPEDAVAGSVGTTVLSPPPPPG